MRLFFFAYSILKIPYKGEKKMTAMLLQDLFLLCHSTYNAMPVGEWIS
jgi:hypothetical protein